MIGPTLKAALAHLDMLNEDGSTDFASMRMAAKIEDLGLCDVQHSIHLNNRCQLDRGHLGDHVNDGGGHWGGLGLPAIEGPLSGYKAVNVTQQYSLAAVWPPSPPKPGPVRIVLSAMPELLLAWLLIWMDRLLPGEDER